MNDDIRKLDDPAEAHAALFVHEVLLRALWRAPDGGIAFHRAVVAAIFEDAAGTMRPAPT